MRAHSRADTEEVVNYLPTPANANTKDSTTTPTETKPKAKTRRIAAWEDAGDLPRVIAMNRALDRFGVPMAFSVNFDPKLIKAGNDNARGQLDYYRRRIALALKRAVGETPAMWIAVETDDDGRQHCHGGLALNDRHDPAAMLDGLATASGNWTRQGSAPADLRAQHDLDGWAIYPFKRAPRTRRDLREAAGLDADARVTLYSCTDDLRTEAKRVYEEARRAIGSSDRTHKRDQTAREIVQEARQRAATLEAPETAPALPEPPCEPAVNPEPASEAGAATQVGSARPAPAATARLSTAGICAGLVFTVPAQQALAGPFRMLATARSRGPPARVHRPSAGPDPPLAERLLIREITEHELPALPVTECDDGRSGHEASLPRDDGFPMDPRPASHGDDNRRVRVADRPRSGTTDRAWEGDPELSEARVVARRLPSRSGAVSELSGDRDGEDRRGLGERSTGEEERQQGGREVLHAPPVAATAGLVTYT